MEENKDQEVRIDMSLTEQIIEAMLKKLKDSDYFNDNVLKDLMKIDLTKKMLS